MYAIVYFSQKVSAFEQAQLARDAERRRKVAARTRRTGAARPEPVTSGRLRALVPRFAAARVRPA